MDALKAEHLGHRAGEIGYIRLDEVAQTVQTCRCGEVSRAAHGQLGVNQRKICAQVLVHDTGLLAVYHHNGKHTDLAA